jgi:hypothetical protein
VIPAFQIWDFIIQILSDPWLPVPDPWPSVFAHFAVNRVGLASLYCPFGVMAVGADGRARRAPVLEARILVNVVTVDAGRVLYAADDHVANISVDVAVAGVEAFIIRL